VWKTIRIYLQFNRVAAVALGKEKKSYLIRSTISHISVTPKYVVVSSIGPTPRISMMIHKYEYSSNSGQMRGIS